MREGQGSLLDVVARRSERSGSPSLFGARSAMCLCACAGVMTAHSLGATWLGTPILGLPVGVLLIGAAVGGMSLMRRSALRERGVQDQTESSLEAWAGQHEPTLFDSAQPKWRPERDRLVVLVRGVPKASTSVVATLTSRHPAAGTPITWANDAPEDEADAVVDFVDGGVVVRFWTFGTGGDRTPWSDRACDLSYESIFPKRFNPSEIRISAFNPAQKRQVRLLLRLIEAGITAARFFEDDDRFIDEAPSDWNPAAAVESAMTALAEALEQDWEDGSGAAAGVAQAAAAVVGGFLAVWEGTIEDEDRRQAAEAAFAIGGESVESLLRIATVRIATYADDEGRSALEAAQRRLALGTRCTTDTLHAVFGEIEQGSSSALTLGRIAVGVTLLWATVSDASIAYLRDDLLEDFRYAGWLCGRDQDHRLLKELLYQAERLRGAQRPNPLKFAA